MLVVLLPSIFLKTSCKLKNMRTIDRITELLLSNGVPKHKVASTLARLCGITTQAVYAWDRGETEKISPEYISKIALRYGSSSDYLISGRVNEVRESTAGSYFVPAGEIPLISWVRAGSWDDPTDNYHPGDAEAWVPSPPSCNPAMTFALVVTGESMDDGTMQGYRDGELIYVDGSRINPEHNADVIVRNGDGKVTFKRLVLSNGDWYLKPLNPNWPEKIIQMDDASHIVGRVVFSGKVRI